VLAAAESAASTSWPPLLAGDDYEDPASSGGGPEYATHAFTGREWDRETGLYYYRARYYDPKAGRFISEDPIGFEGGINFYAYVANRPTVFRDPDGTNPVIAVGIGVLVAWYVLGEPTPVNTAELPPGAQPASDPVGVAVGAGVGVVTGPVIGKVASKLAGHHVFPRAFRPFFERVGIDIDRHLVSIPVCVHRWLHSGKGTGPGGQWNATWRQFIAKNPNASTDEIFDQLLKMLDEIGLGGPPTP
jgi:RHS repeat-associated protein